MRPTTLDPQPRPWFEFRVEDTDGLGVEASKLSKLLQDLSSAFYTISSARLGHESAGAYASRAMTNALRRASLTQSDVQAVFAHATGTQVGDAAEVEAMRLTFGTDLSLINITAIKSSLGHLTGASGAVQAVAAAKSLATQCIPPTRNVTEIDSTTPLSLVVEQPKRTTLSNVMSNSFGFGGQNVSLVFSRHCKSALADRATLGDENAEHSKGAKRNQT